MFGEAFNNINTEAASFKKTHIFCCALFIIRRLNFVFVIFMFDDKPWLQIILVTYIHYAVWIINIYMKPLASRSSNFIEGFNDYIIFLCSLNVILFTDFVPDVETKFFTGWIMCDTISLMIFVNIAYLLKILLNR